jgi:hypothetical protein
MSFYSSVSNNIILNNIICQYEIEHEIPNSDNQCSWYVYCILNSLKENNWLVPELPDDLKKMHENSLKIASEFRSKYRKVSWGESIFSKTIQEQFNLSIGSPNIIKIGNCQNNNFLMIDKMQEIIDFKLNLQEYNLSDFNRYVSECFATQSYILVNRHGQSFLIYPYKNNKFIIFDSHVKEIGLFDNNGILKYVLNKSKDNLITFIKGYKSESKLDNIVYDDSK